METVKWNTIWCLKTSFWQVPVGSNLHPRWDGWPRLNTFLLHFEHEQTQWQLFSVNRIMWCIATHGWHPDHFSIYTLHGFLPKAFIRMWNTWHNSAHALRTERMASTCHITSTSWHATLQSTRCLPNPTLMKFTKHWRCSRHTECRSTHHSLHNCCALRKQHLHSEDLTLKWFKTFSSISKAMKELRENYFQNSFRHGMNGMNA